MADMPGAGGELDPALVASIDCYVAATMETHRIPGVALGLYRNGRAVLAKGYGLANVEHRVPVTADTVMQSGSIGKCFTATAVMMLVEQGAIGLDDTIVDVFVQAPESWRPITVAHLLSHTSGVGGYDTLEHRGRGGRFDLQRNLSEDELVSGIFELPLEFPAGRDWAYSNSGYALLGILIRRLTGLSYADFLEQNIFAPLGMAASRVICELDIVPNRAAGYELHDGALRNQEWVAPFFNSLGDGALYVTIADLERWDHALHGTDLLKRETLERMWTPYRLQSGVVNVYGYGYGWRVKHVNGRRLVEHAGAWQGFSGFLSRDVDQRLTIALLTNLMVRTCRPEEIAQAILGMVDPTLAITSAEHSG